MLTLASIITDALAKGASQIELAERANLSQARISDLANGKGLPRRRGVADLAAALRYPVEDLQRVIAADRRRRARRRPQVVGK